MVSFAKTYRKAPGKVVSRRVRRAVGSNRELEYRYEVLQALKREAKKR